MTYMLIIAALVALWQREHDTALVLAVLAVAVATKRPGWLAAEWKRNIERAETDKATGESLFSGSRDE